MSKSQFCLSAVSDTAGALVAASSAVRTIDAASICNVTAGAVTLSLWIVPQSGSRSDANKLIHEQSIAAGVSLTLPTLVNQAVPRLATIHAQAGAASSLTLAISGRDQ